jgi:phage tail-like protein
MTEEDRQIRILKYLPAIFHTDPTDDPAQPAEASYLEGFLGPFQDVLTGFEERLSGIDRYFDPKEIPSDQNDDFLSWLAGWVGLVLDENWEKTKRQQLIREAVKLHRHRGMVAGLKRFLSLYDDRITCVVHEGRWPGGMQIGVASQIGGITTEHGSVSMSRIERMERQQPPVRHDYYVVDTVAPANHPDVPEGQPLRLYYRADWVKSVKVGQFLSSVGVEYQGDLEAGELSPDFRREFEDHGITLADDLAIEVEVEGGKWQIKENDTGLTYIVSREGEALKIYEGQDHVTLRLLDGRLRRHQPATVVRYDGLVHERYSLTIESESGRETAIFRGSTFLIEEVEMPYRFTIDIQVPHEVWEEWKEPANVREEEEPTPFDPAMHEVREEWMQPAKVRAIRAIIDEMKPAHTLYCLKLTHVMRGDHE